MSDELEIIPKPNPLTENQAEVAVQTLKKLDFNFDLTKQKCLALVGKWQIVGGMSETLLAMGFHNVEQIQRAQKAGLEIMENPKVDPKTRILGGLLLVAASKASNEQMNSLRELAKEAGAMPESTKRKHSPPMLLEAHGEVHIHEALPPKIA